MDTALRADGVDTAPGDCCPPLTAAMDREQAIELAAVLKVLADPTRLQLLSIIAGSGTEMCACEFPDLLDRSQSTTSHHLSQLVAAGILEREQRGKWAWFRLRRDRIEAIAAALHA